MINTFTSGKVKPIIKSKNLVTKAHKYSNSMGNNRNLYTQTNTYSNWDSCIDKYIWHLRAKGLANRTVKEVPYILNRLKIFCLNRGIYDINFVREKDILDFAKEEIIIIKLSTLATKITNIKQFFSYLAKEELITYDVTVNIKAAKAPKPKFREILTPADFVKLVSVINTMTVQGFLYRTIIELFYACGIRIRELVNLTLKDINLHDHKVHIYGSKTLKERVLPLTELAVRYLNVYLTFVRPKIISFALKKHDTEILFLNIYGTKLDPRAINTKIKAYTKEAGIDKVITSHSFRFAYASHLFENKADIRHICELLGHRSLSMTAKYIVVSKKALVDVVKKHHPREKGRF